MKLQLIVTGIAASVATAPVLADRPPTTNERNAVEQALRANGFISREEIELDDDGPVWEIDDARTANSARAKFDIKISPRTMKIVKRERDD